MVTYFRIVAAEHKKIEEKKKHIFLSIALSLCIRFGQYSCAKRYEFIQFPIQQ